MILGHGSQLEWIGYAGGKPREEWFVKDALQGTRKAPNEPSGHVGECLVPRPSPRPFQCVTSPSTTGQTACGSAPELINTVVVHLKCY